MGDIVFKVISATENSNKFRRKNSGGRGNTWPKGTGHTGVHYFLDEL